MELSLDNYFYTHKSGEICKKGRIERGLKKSRLVLQNRQKAAFTLAEVIITLIVIGVVAAITVPMMNNSVADKKWNVAKQKAKATIGEAFRLMTVNGEITTNKTTAQFVEEVIPKYLKLEKTCAPNDYKDCGFPSTVKTPNGVTVGISPKDYKWSELSMANVWQSHPNREAAVGGFTTFPQKYGNTYDASYYFRTIDGFSVAFFYNPYCVNDTRERYTFYKTLSGELFYAQTALDMLCLMGIYDMNGKQGPNKVGMDIGFVGSFYNGFETRSAAVLPHSEEKRYDQVPSVPKWNNKNDRWGALVNYCNNLGKDNEWVIPSLDEMILLAIGKKLINNSKAYEEKWFWTSTPVNGGANGYFRCVTIRSIHGHLTDFEERSYVSASGSGPRVRCVRNNALK